MLCVFSVYLFAKLFEHPYRSRYEIILTNMKTSKYLYGKTLINEFIFLVPWKQFSLYNYRSINNVLAELNYIYHCLQSE